MPLDWDTQDRHGQGRQDDGSSSESAKPSLWDRLNQPIGASGKGKGAGAASGRASGSGGDASPAANPAPTSRASQGSPSSDAPESVEPTQVLHEAPSPSWKGSKGVGRAEGGKDAGSKGKGSGLKGRLNQPIGSKGRGSALPSKRVMNLYQPAAGQASPRTTAIVGVCLAVAVILFIRFAIVMPYQQVAEKQQELSEAQAQLAPIKEQVADYDQVLQQYQQYTPVSSSSGVDATAVMTLVEDHVKNRATVTTMDLEDTTLTITVTNVSLQTVGEIAADLGQQQAAGVKSATVSSAATLTGDASDTSNVVANITVEMIGNASDSDSSGSSSDSSGSSDSSSSSTSSSTSASE